MNLDDLIRRVATGSIELARGEIAAAVALLLDETQPVEARANFLGALHDRGETPAEVWGFALELLERAVPLPGVPGGTMDVCGTGGDRSGTFNVSTAVMFVAAGAGARIAKHGNRAITSRCGAADVIEALGIPVNHPPETAARQLASIGCTFLFAPLYHPAVKAVAPVRKSLAERNKVSIFNLLGPLINPAKPDFQLVGLHDPASLPLYAQALGGLGRKRAWAVHGSGPAGFRLDELSTCGPSLAHEAGCPRPFTIDPAALGLPMALPSDLEGGDAPANARIILDLLEGKDRGPRRDIVCLNAAAALMVCGVAADWPEGLHMAGDAMDSGAASGKLTALRATA
jgi:anthranilate phosphoribosyltransferase